MKRKRPALFFFLAHSFSFARPPQCLRGSSLSHTATMTTSAAAAPLPESTQAAVRKQVRVEEREREAKAGASVYFIFASRQAAGGRRRRAGRGGRRPGGLHRLSLGSLEHWCIHTTHQRRHQTGLRGPPPPLPHTQKAAAAAAHPFSRRDPP